MEQKETALVVWSSSQYSFNDNNAWIVDLSSGNANNNNKNNNNYVCGVRDFTRKQGSQYFVGLFFLCYNFFMALYYDLPVFKDVYRMTLKIFQVTSNFPREYKFTLGQDLKRDCIELVRYIYRANKNKEKALYLEQFLDSFEVVKLELRLCVDLKLVSIPQQAEFIEFTEKIGKQITAWRNKS